MSGFKIGGVGASGGGGGLFPKDEHVGDLLAIVDPEAKQEIKTAFGPAEAIAFRYLVCVDHDQVWTDSLLFGDLLYRDIVEEIDTSEIVVIRLTRGSASAGRSAPWLAEPPTPEDLELVLKWMETHAERMPSGRIEILAPKRKPDDGGVDEPF